ncbi:MAG: TIGR02391 family protein [Acidimicrobiales bacterium]
MNLLPRIALAVLEAVKGLGDRVRSMSGVQGDGAALVQAVFALGSTGLPMFAFNSLRSDSERSEQTGLVNLMIGVFGTFRNPTAHEPKGEMERQ